jgi:CDP-paratose 2-epimerase
MTPGNTRPELRVTRGGAGEDGPVLITGGAGFIGTNIAHRYLAAGVPVTIFDNLSRPGVEKNLRWLRAAHGALLRVEIADVRDASALRRAVAPARQVVHLAAQVAVTTSLADPAEDFQVNTQGTLNLLEALRAQDQPPPLLFTSTNKVYGCLAELPLTDGGRRYEPQDAAVRARGICEGRPLDFHSPYGCSKGAADQYVLDYTRSYGLAAAVFRMSCIYGPHQFGTEDQGWVAHFLIRALAGDTITLFGDGHQVRDILFVEDLVDAVEAAFRNMEVVSGHPFNIGGGPGSTTSLLELVEAIADLTGEPPALEFSQWRTGDQKYYVSDTSRFTALTGWRPRHGPGEGLRALHDWLVRAGRGASGAHAPHAPRAPGAQEWRDRLAEAAAAGER